MGGLTVTFTEIHRQRDKLWGGRRRRKIKIEWKQGGSVKSDGLRIMKDGEGETEMKKS